MPTGDKSRVDINQMGGQASSPGGGGGRPVSVFEWIGEAAKGVGSACFHTLTGPAAGPLIFVGICAALAYRIKRLEGKRPVLHRSMSIAALHGGHMTLERILDAQEARVDRKALDSAAAEMRNLLGKDPTEISYRELHRLGAKLEMSGREDEAITMLKEAVKKAEENKHPHEAHELQMLLVEMLVYKGEYDRALGCKCLEDNVISDARGPLYKAIIYSLKGDGRARGCYERFQEIRRCFYWCDFLEGTPLHGMVHEYDEFKKITENLKKEIEHAKTTKP